MEQDFNLLTMVESSFYSTLYEAILQKAMDLDKYKTQKIIHRWREDQQVH